MNPEKTTEYIRGMLADYLAKYQALESLVIGVSGGIDSALCCALAKPVCEKAGVKLIGRSLPIISNESDEIHRAKLVGNAFCHDFEEVDLGHVFHHLRSDVVLTNGIDEFASEQDEFKAKVRMGNVKARIRMIYLYDLAQYKNGLVLSTDNFTELLLGFWTLHGDVGDLGMIQNLWKTEVYDLASYIASDCVYGKAYDNRAEALKLCIEANPTDGLGVASGDLEQFGVKSYEEVDRVLKDLVGGNEVDPTNPVIMRYHNAGYKRDNPFNFPRSVVAED